MGWRKEVTWSCRLICNQLKHRSQWILSIWRSYYLDSYRMRTSSIDGVFPKLHGSTGSCNVRPVRLRCEICHAPRDAPLIGSWVGTAPWSWVGKCWQFAIRRTWGVAIDTFYKHRWHQRFDYKLYHKHVKWQTVVNGHLVSCEPETLVNPRGYCGGLVIEGMVRSGASVDGWLKVS